MPESKRPFSMNVFPNAGHLYRQTYTFVAQITFWLHLSPILPKWCFLWTSKTRFIKLSIYYRIKFWGLKITKTNLQRSTPPFSLDFFSNAIGTNSSILTKHAVSRGGMCSFARCWQISCLISSKVAFSPLHPFQEEIWQISYSAGKRRCQFWNRNML